MSGAKKKRRRDPRGVKRGTKRGPYKSKIDLSAEELQRRDVMLLRSFELTPTRIAGVMKIELKQLVERFATELEHGATLANLEVARNFFRWATDSKDPRSINAAKFWLQERAGWRDSYVIPPSKQADVPDEEETMPKLGKKEQAELAAHKPDTSSNMGRLIAKRMAMVN